MKPPKWLAIGMLVACHIAAVDCAAADPVRILRSLPMNEQELSEAFHGATQHACRPVALGRPLEIREPSLRTAADVQVNLSVRVGGKEFPVPMARRAVLSVGLMIQPEDVPGLPFLSSSLIQSYIENHYVCFEVLVRRDLDSGTYRLHDVGVAACLTCKGAQLTDDFEPLVRQSLRDTRCLGFYRAPDSADDDDAELLVFAVRNPMFKSMPGNNGKTEPSYELMFVRSRSATSSGEDEMPELHVFTTAENRAKLHYLKPFAPPTSNLTCDLVGSVVMTRYAADGLTPAESALRSLAIRARASLAASDLDRFSGEDIWLKKPTRVLDAIIAGELK